MLVEFKLGAVLREFQGPNVVGPTTAVVFWNAYDSKWADPILGRINGNLHNTPQRVFEHLEEMVEEIQPNSGFTKEDYADLFWKLEWTGYCYKYKGAGAEYTKHPIVLITSNDRWVPEHLWSPITTRDAIDIINSITETPDNV